MVMGDIRYIRVIRFWCRKQGFSLSSTAQKCTRKVRLYKPYTSGRQVDRYN